MIMIMMTMMTMMIMIIVTMKIKVKIFESVYASIINHISVSLSLTFFHFQLVTSY